MTAIEALKALDGVSKYVNEEAYSDGTDNEVLDALRLVETWLAQRSTEDMEDENKGLDDNKFLEKFDKDVDDLIEVGEIPGSAAKDAKMDEALAYAKPGETVTKTTVSKSKDGPDMADILKGLKLE